MKKPRIKPFQFVTERECVTERKTRGKWESRAGECVVSECVRGVHVCVCLCVRVCVCVAPGYAAPKHLAACANQPFHASVSGLVDNSSVCSRANARAGTRTACIHGAEDIPLPPPHTPQPKTKTTSEKNTTRYEQNAPLGSGQRNLGPVFASLPLASQMSSSRQIYPAATKIRSQ